MSKENALRQSTREIDWIDLDVLWEDFAGTRSMKMKPGNLKQKAAHCMNISNVDYLDKKTSRKLWCKKRKLRRSFRKHERSRSHLLVRHINWYLNFVNAR